MLLGAAFDVSLTRFNANILLVLHVTRMTPLLACVTAFQSNPTNSQASSLGHFRLKIFGTFCYYFIVMDLTDKGKTSSKFVIGLYVIYYLLPEFTVFREKIKIADAVKSFLCP